MRFTLALAIVAAAASSAQAASAGLDFGAIFDAMPSLAKQNPTPNPNVNRQVAVKSVLSVMSQRKPKATAVQKPKSTKKTTKKTTKKGKTINAKKVIEKPSAKIAPKIKLATNNRAAGCAPQEIHYGFVPSDNTPNGFLMDSSLLGFISRAQTPAGYASVFTNQIASAVAGDYLGYIQQASYNPAECAAYCDSTTGCNAFNIYYERNPTQDPTPNMCPNPSAAVSVRCAIYGSKFTLTAAINVGQWRTDFLTVISGSNGYVKSSAPAPVTGFITPKQLTGLVSVTTIDGKAISISNKLYPGAYDPSQCATECRAINSKNRQVAGTGGKTSYVPCSYFTASILSTGGTSQGTYCAYFNSTAVEAYGTITSQSMNGVAYDVSNTFGFATSDASPGVIVTPITCANWGDGTTWTDRSNNVYTLRCASYTNGGNVQSAQLASFSSCVNACAGVTNCSGVRWSSGAKTCYYQNMTAVARPVAWTAASAFDSAYLPAFVA